MDVDDQDAGPPRGILPPEAPPPEGDSGPAAWRLTFTYTGDEITLVAQQRVAMIAPPDDSERTYAARAGTWVEVRDSTGRGLYRQILADPVRHGYEVHSSDPEEPYARWRGAQRAAVAEGSSRSSCQTSPVLTTSCCTGSPTARWRPMRRGPDVRPTAHWRQSVLTATLEETPPYEVT